MDFIELRDLTEKTFHPFGKLISLPERSPDITRENLSWWGNLYDLPFTDAASMGYLRIFRKDLVVDALERHVKAPEVFILIQGAGIMPFAPPSDNTDPNAEPDESKITAFILYQGQGLIINPGVWHSPGLALTGTMDFILTVRKETADDIDMKNVQPREICL